MMAFTYPCLVLIDTDGALHAHFETDGCGALKPPYDPYDEPHNPLGIDQVPSGTQWRFVAGGSYHACALDDVGAATCWGLATQALDAPKDVRFTELSATDGATCGITTDGHIRCWAGTVSDPWEDPWSNSWIPDDVPTSGGWAHVVMGDSDDHFACAIDAAGQVSCFGAGYQGYTSLANALDNPVDEPPTMPLY